MCVSVELTAPLFTSYSQRLLRTIGNHLERRAKAPTGESQLMAREIAKAYEPQQIEPRWAEFWVKEELFRADANAPGPVKVGPWLA